MPDTIKRYDRTGAEREYEFVGVTDGKACFHLVPQDYPVPPYVKLVITRPFKQEA